MREIKYQAFIKNVGECFEVEYLHIVSQEVEVRLFPKGVTQLFSYSKENKEAVLRQFTGLLDKNGKEIYEGDIVKVSEEYGGYAYTPLVVDFKDCCFVLRRINYMADYNPMFKYDFRKAYEVIGNIYTHPHLLEGDTQ